MAEQDRFLTSDEVLRVEGGPQALYRARALAEVVKLAEALGLPEDQTQSVVERARTRLGETAHAKKYARSLGHVTSLLYGTTEQQPPRIAEADGEEDTSSGIKEDAETVQPKAEPAADILATPTALEQTESVARAGLSEPVSNEVHMAEGEGDGNIAVETDVQSDPLPERGLRFLSGFIEGVDRMALSKADIPAVVDTVIRLRGEKRARANVNMIDDAVVVKGLLEGMSLADIGIIAAEKPSSEGSIQQLLYNLRKKIARDTSLESAAATLSRAVDAFRAGVRADGLADTFGKTSSEAIVTDESAPSRPLPKPPTVRLVPPALEKEIVRPVDAEAKDHERIAGLAAEQLSLDSSLQKALEMFLDPEATDVVSENKKKVVWEIIDYVNIHYGSIDDERLGLTDQQKAYLRQMTGTWYKKVDDSSRVMPMRPLSSILKNKGGRPQELVTSDVHSAFEKIFSGETGEDDGAEWDRTMRETIINGATRVGMDHTVAEALWNQLHFSDSYKQDTPEGREAAARLLQLFNETDSPVIDEDAHIKVAVKSFVFRGLGYNDLDVIYERLRKKDSSLTPLTVQRKLATGIGELLK